MMFLTLCPRSSSRKYPNCFSAWTFRRTMFPLAFTTTMASGAASSGPRYFAADSLLSVMSRLISEKPRSRPDELRVAVMTTLAQNFDPSLRTRQRSISERLLVASDLKLRLGDALIDIALKIEARKIPPDDLMSFVALHALGSGIPGDDVPAWIEGEDGIVLYALEEQPIVFFVDPQRFLDKLASGDIALNAPGSESGDQ